MNENRRKFQSVFKISFIVSLIFLISTSLYAYNNCYFNTYNSSCPSLLNATNNLTISQLTSNSLFDRYDLKVYNKYNPNNILKFNSSNQKINQIMPFLDDGEYVFEFQVYLKNGKSFTKKFDYRFRNSDVMPPIVNTSLITGSNSLKISGLCEPNSKIFANYNNQNIQGNSDSKGEFQITLSNLKDGNNYVEFYCQDKKGRKSKIIRRLIHPKISPNDINFEQATIKSVDSINKYNKNCIGNTCFERSIFISGNITTLANPKGTLVFVNGIKTLADKDGRFGTFILLNNGLNNITIETNGDNQSLQIDYVRPFFRFYKIDYKKVITQKQSSISGNCSSDIPFLVFLNGVYLQKVQPNNKKFSFNIQGFNVGQNLVELRGVNGEIADLVIYRDSALPQVSLISSKNMSNAENMIFKISDDIGINISSVQLKIDNNLISNNKLSIKDDYYIYNISSVPQGVHPVNIVGSDFVGNQFQYSGNIDIDSNVTTLSKVILNGKIIGNQIFTKKGKQTLHITPSKNVAFKSIYLNNKRVIDYEIKRNNEILLNIDFTGKKGILKLNFVNSKYEEHNMTYYYHTEDDKPVIELNYINHPYTKNFILLTGRITDPYFDWATLKFNSDTTFTRYGTYFEAVVTPSITGSSNLQISGLDFAQNSVSKVLGGVLFKDTTKSNVQKDANVIQNKNFSGSIYSDDELKGNFNYVEEADGLEYNKLYLSADHFVIPISDIYGLRSVELYGFESSSNSFYSSESIKVNSSYNIPILDFSSLPTKIYLVNLHNKTKFSSNTINGFINANNIKSLTISNNGNCQSYLNSFSCKVNLQNGQNSFKVCVVDDTNKQTCKDVNITKVVPNLDIQIDKIFGNGVYNLGSKTILINTDAFLNGTITPKGQVFVIIDGYQSFIGNKSNKFMQKLNFGTALNRFNQKEINIQLKGIDENGFVKFSNKIKVYFQRIFGSVAQVIIN